jgi:hypothetical protein
LAVPLLLTSCVFAPQAVDSDMDARCDLVTESYTLKADYIGGNFSANCGRVDASFCLAGLVVIPATSLIVSGSIVALGNTAHWLEYQGSCSESETRRATAKLVNATEAAGGHVLKTSGDVVAWVKAFSRPAGNLPPHATGQSPAH